MKTNKLLIFLLAVVLALPDVVNAGATWDGAPETVHTQNWSQAINWDGDTVPEQNTDVTFGTGGTYAVVDTPRTVKTITLNRTGGFTISAPSLLTINSGIKVSAPYSYVIGRDADTYRPAVSISGMQTFDVVDGGTLQLLSNVQNSGDITVNGGGTTKLGMTLAYFSLAGTVTKNGAGTLQLAPSADNGTTLGVIVNGGTLQGLNNGYFKSLCLNAGSTYDINGTATINTLTGSGNIITTNNLFTPKIGEGSYGGVLSGIGYLTKFGTGTLIVSGNNTYTGITKIEGGKILLNKLGGLGDVGALTMSSGTVFDLGDASDTIGSLAGEGNVRIPTGTLTTGGNNTSTTFSGVIGGDGKPGNAHGADLGGLIKIGTGTFTVKSTCYTGDTVINNGVLLFSRDDKWTHAGAIANTTVDTVSTLALDGKQRMVPAKGIHSENINVNVASARALLDLSANSGSQTFRSITGSGDLWLGANTALTVGIGGQDTTLYGAIKGDATSSITKVGAGKLFLRDDSGYGSTAPNNLYKGDFIVNAGTLYLNSYSGMDASSSIDAGKLKVNGGTVQLAGYTSRFAGLTGAVGGNIVLGTTLDVTVGDTRKDTFAGTLSGSNGGVYKKGSGSLILQGVNTLGSVDVIEGKLELAGNGTMTNNGTMSVRNGSELSLDNTAVLADRLNSSQNINSYGGKLSLIGGSETFSQLYLYDGASKVAVSSDGALTSSALTCSRSSYRGTLDVSGSDLGTANKMIFTTAPTLTNGIIPYVTVNGTDFAAHDGNGTSIRAYTGYTTDINVNDTTKNVRLDVSANMTANRSVNSLNINGNYDVTGNAGTILTIASGGFISNGTADFSVPTISFNNKEGVLNVSGANTVTFSSALTYYDGITKSGSGTVVLANQTNSGSNKKYTVNEGTLTYGGAGVLGVKPYITVAGGTLDFGSYSDTIGSFALSKGTVTGAAGTSVYNTSGGYYNVYDGIIDVSLKSIAGYTNSLSKSGEGTVEVRKACEYTGITYLYGGRMRLGANDVLPDTGAIQISPGAVLDMNNKTDTVGAVTLSGGAITGGTTGKLTGSAYAVTSGLIDANLSGGAAVNLAKTGSGKVYVLSPMTYLGSTTISGGVLALAADNVLPDYNSDLAAGGDVYVTNNGTLDIGHYNDTIHSLTMSYGSVLGSSGTLYLNKLDVNNTSAVTIGANIQIADTLTKGGSSTMTVASPLYVKKIYQQAGTLLAQVDDVFSPDSTTQVDVAAGATLNGGSYRTSLGSLSGAGTVSSSGTLTVGNNGLSTTFSGVLSGSGGNVEKVGTGMLALSGSNTYTGKTAVNTGTLKLSDANGSIKSTSGITITNGTLVIDNTAATNNDRIGNTTPITFGDAGGETDGPVPTLEVIGGAQDVSETIGNIILNRYAQIKLTNLTSYYTELICAALIRNGKGTGNFIGTNMGAAGTDAQRVKFTATPALTSGIIPYAVINGTDFATYDATNGIKAITPAYDKIADATSSTDDIKISASEGLTVSQSIGSLNISGNCNVTGDSGTTLTIGKGGILATGTSLISVPSLVFGSVAGHIFNDNTVTVGSKISGTAGLVKSGSGNLIVNNAACDYSGGVTVNSGTLTGSLDTIRGDSTVYGVLVFDQSAHGTYIHLITGDGKLVKAGVGTLTFSETSSFTGLTEINAGKMVVSGSMADAGFTVKSGGILGGSGALGDVTIGDGGVWAPGNSPGTQLASDVVWEGGGAYLWEINDVTGTQGADPGWDWLDISGTLSVAATSSNPFTIDITSLVSVDNAVGDCSNFSNLEDYEWVLATADGGITGFNRNDFSLIDHFTNAGADISKFFLGQVGSDVKLAYSASGVDPFGGGSGDVPEPSTLLLLLPFIGFGLRKISGKKA